MLDIYVIDLDEARLQFFLLYVHLKKLGLITGRCVWGRFYGVSEGLERLNGYSDLNTMT